MNDLKAGKKLDALVVEKVLGWTRVKKPWEVKGPGQYFIEEHWNTISIHKHGNHGQHFSPSTDISAAMQVVEKMRAEGWFCDMVSVQTTPDIGRWSVIFYNSASDFDGEEASNSLPLAICLAALKAKGAL